MRLQYTPSEDCGLKYRSESSTAPIICVYEQRKVSWVCASGDRTQHCATNTNENSCYWSMNRSSLFWHVSHMLDDIIWIFICLSLWQLHGRVSVFVQARLSCRCWHNWFVCFIDLLFNWLTCISNNFCAFVHEDGGFHVLFWALVCAFEIDR